MSEIINLIPVMTSNTTPSGVASASSSYSGFEAWKAFNGIADGGWQADSGTSWWLKYDFGETSKALVTKYSITASTNAGIARSPKNWTFEGSNDGVNWSVLDTQVNQINWTVGLVREYSFSNEYSFRYYRLNITANNGADVYTNIGELKLFGFIPRINKFLILSNDERLLSISEGLLESDFIPKLTSSNQDGFIVTTSSQDSSYQAWKIFDDAVGSTSSIWKTASGNIGWVAIKLPFSRILSKYSIYKSSGFGVASSWTFEGSNDGSNWTILDTQINHTEKNNMYYDFPLNTTNSYNNYRININGISSGTVVYLDELKLYNKSEPGDVVILNSSSEKNFINYGLDKLAQIDLSSQMTNKVFIEQSPTTLGSGKVFSRTIDTTKTPIKKVTIK